MIPLPCRATLRTPVTTDETVKKMTQHQTLSKTVARAIPLILILSVIQGSAGAISLDTTGAPVDGTEELAYLAKLFSETPGSTSAADSGVSVTCGQSGHCNILTCETDCDPGETAQCSCHPEETRCEDNHGWWWEDDEHNMYSCECSCYSGNPPPDPNPESCIVKSPFTGECIIDEICSTSSTIQLPERAATRTDLARTTLPDLGMAVEPAGGC